MIPSPDPSHRRSVIIIMTGCPLVLMNTEYTLHKILRCRVKIISQREYVHWCDPGHYAHDAAAGHLAPSQAVTKRGSSNVNFTSTAKWVLHILGRCCTKLNKVY